MRYDFFFVERLMRYDLLLNQTPCYNNPFLPISNGLKKRKYFWWNKIFKFEYVRRLVFFYLLSKYCFVTY